MSVAVAGAVAAAGAAAAGAPGDECPVCVRRTTAWAKCEKCSYSVCKRCVAANIEARPMEAPRCMNCSAVWGLRQIARSTSALFMNGKFRRIRQDFLLARERAIMPICARSLALRREISRFDGEILAADDRVSKLRREIRNLPQWSNLIYKENHRKRANVVGACANADCNGLLVRGKIAPGAGVSVHCLSCSRVGKPQPRIDARVTCPDCCKQTTGTWMSARTPFVMTRCCGREHVIRLQKRGADGKWTWATEEETVAAAAGVGSSTGAEGVLLQYKFSDRIRQVGSWGMSVLDSAARALFVKRVQRDLNASTTLPPGLDGLTGQILVEMLSETLVSDDSLVSKIDKEMMLELCDKNGPAADIAALAPGTLVAASGMPMDIEWIDTCEFNSDRVSRLRPCACSACVHNIRYALRTALVRAPLEYLNNETSRAEYEAEMLRLSGLSHIWREVRSIVIMYRCLFAVAMLRYTENRLSRGDCVAILSLAHRVATEMIDAAREHYT